MMILLQATEAVAVAAEQAPKTMGLGELFLAGGFLMWPLLILGGVAVFIFFERFWANPQGFGRRYELHEPDSGAYLRGTDRCRRTALPPD